MDKDPLEDAGNDIQEPKYYRIDNVIFAEPIPTNLINIKGSGDTITLRNEECELHNTIVQRQRDDRKKYNIDIQNECKSNFECPQESCGKAFKTNRLMKSHIRKVHCADRQRFICECCCMGFPALYLLKRHSLTHSRDTVQCPVCSHKLSRRTDMRVHLRTHSGVRNHQCHICRKQFTRRSVLATHLRSVHKNIRQEISKD